MNFELINPSDPYTMRAPSFEAAVLAALLIQPDGMMPVRQLGDNFESVEGGEVSPFAINCDIPLWYEGRFGRSIGAGIDAIASDVTEALRGVMIGSPAERCRMERVLGVIQDPGDRERAAEAWHDQKRSSINDIGGRARKIANRLAAKATEGA